MGLVLLPSFPAMAGTIITLPFQGERYFWKLALLNHTSHSLYNYTCWLHMSDFKLSLVVKCYNQYFAEVNHSITLDIDNCPSGNIVEF